MAICQVRDIDGNIYRTVKIGDQEWTAENLRVTKFRNGDPIPYIRSLDAWTHADMNKRSGYCFYKADTSLAKTYGNLYNYYAVSDPKNIAPEGWHVATKADWEKLRDNILKSMMITFRRNDFAGIAKRYVQKLKNINKGDFNTESEFAPIHRFNDSLARAGFKQHHGLHYDIYHYAGNVNMQGIETTNLGIISGILSKDPIHWDSISNFSYSFKKHFFENDFENIPANGTDLFGFNGLPAGTRDEGNYRGLKNITCWWTSSQAETGRGLGILFELGGFFAHMKDYWEAVEIDKTAGMPVRLVKDK